MKLSLVAAALVLVTLGGCAGDPEQRLAQAATQYAHGEYRLAAIELQNLLQSDPQNVQATLLLGRVWLALGEVEAAEQRLTAAREMGAAAEDFALPLAYAFIQSGRPNQARTELDRVPESARNADWFTALGETHVVGGERAAAESAFQRALTLEPKHYDAVTGLGRAAGVGADWTVAFEHSDAAVALDPERHEAYLVRGHAQLRAGNVAAAERDFLSAADILERGDASRAELDNLVTLAQVQLTLNRAEELQATAARARRRATDSVASSYIEGLADVAQGRHREAIPKLKQTAAAAA